MKRNMERSSGSSDEDKTSLKKAKKENSGKLKNAETEIGETVNGINNMYSSGRNAQVGDCKRNVEKDADGSICGIDFTHKLHSGSGISNDTLASNGDTINKNTCTILVSCLNSFYNRELENNIDSYIGVGFPNHQREEVKEKESSKNHGHEIAPSRRSLLDEASNLGTSDNEANTEGSINTRKRLFCCPQSAFNNLTEDIDHCVKRPCNCLGVQHRSNQNDQNGFSGADKREISGIIHSPLLHSINERNIGSLHYYHNNSLFIERRESNYRTNSHYNFATNIDESSRERTISQNVQEKYRYEAKCFGGKFQEINQHSSEHSLWDETNIIDALVDYFESVDGGSSISRRLFCCPQNALIYLLEDIDNEWRRALCSCQIGGSNRCADRGSSGTLGNHSHEHNSYRELHPLVSGGQGYETAVLYPSNRTENSDQEVPLNFHQLYKAYVDGIQNVENVVGNCGEVEISDCKVEAIPVCESRENNNQARQFHFVSGSTLSNDAHRARNSDDARDTKEYDDNVEEVNLLDEERGDGYNDGHYNEGDGNHDYDEAEDDYDEAEDDYDEAEDDYDEAEDDYDEAEDDYDEAEDDYDEAEDDYNDGHYNEAEDDDSSDGEYLSPEREYVREQSEDVGYISADGSFSESSD